MRLVERTEDLMKLDSHAGLARLANDTGGFLVSETNNLRGALRRIDEDTRFHYLLTYVPKNLDFDGRFRAIDVKVKRPGVERVTPATATARCARRRPCRCSATKARRSPRWTRPGCRTGSRSRAP